MPKYRSKPRNIEMFRFTVQTPADWPEPFQSMWGKAIVRRTANSLLLATAGNGEAVVHKGDWIVLDAIGHVYSLDDEVQRLCYDLVED